MEINRGLGVFIHEYRLLYNEAAATLRKLADIDVSPFGSSPYLLYPRQRRRNISPMKNVLIISPYFPPSSMPPVHRVRLMVNYLEEFGWHPIILTINHEYYEEKLDWELWNSLPEGLEIYHTRAFPAKWSRIIGIGNICIRAYIHLLLTAKRLCREKKIDVVFMQPNPIFWIIGRFIKHSFNIPYVVDYQDPWVSEYGRSVSSLKKAWWANRLARLLEPMVLKRVDHVVGVSQGTYDKIRTPYSFLKDANFTELPFGAEPKDCEYLETCPRVNTKVNSKKNVINFVYVGAISYAMHEILHSFMLAIKKIKETKPQIYKKTNLRFFGSTYAYKITPDHMVATLLANEVGIEDIVEEHPQRLKYFDAMRTLRESDVILAFSLTTSPHYTASKIYPCILARRPILAVFHEKSLVVKTLHDLNIGSVVTFSESHPVEECVDRIAEEIEYYVQKRSLDMPPVDQAIFEKYSARNMTQKLARTFDRTIGLSS